MAQNSKSLDVTALVQGEGALTWDEAQTLAAQYRTAERAENLGRLRKARISYVIVKRGSMDSNGALVSLGDIAKAWNVSKANLSHGADAYGVLVDLGVAGLSDAVQRDALVAADRLRKMGKSDAVKAAVAGGLADVLALPVDQRAEALDAATARDGAIATAAREARSGERGAGKSGEEKVQGTSHADVLKTLDALNKVISEFGQTWNADALAEVSAKVQAIDSTLAGASALVAEYAAA